MTHLEIATILAAKPPHEVAQIAHSVLTLTRDLIPAPQRAAYRDALIVVNINVAEDCQPPVGDPPPPPPSPYETIQ
jgi:hypothetical protein